MVADEDGVLYFSYYNGASNDLYRLRYDPAEDIYRVHLLGNFGEGNYPACLTLAKRNDAAQGEGGFSVPVAPAMRAEAVTRTEEDVAGRPCWTARTPAQDVRPVAAEVAEPPGSPCGGPGCGAGRHGARGPGGPAAACGAPACGTRDPVQREDRYPDPHGGRRDHQWTHHPGV